MSSESPKVFIIVLNFNQKAFTLDCIASFKTLTYPNAELVVVDNASSDDSEAAFKEAFPELCVLQTGKNLGYTGGNNLGMQYALDHDADYVLVVNPDTVVVNPEFVTELVNYMEARREVGIAGPKVFWHDTDTIQNTVLHFPYVSRRIATWFKYRLNPQAFDLSKAEPVEAEVLNGVCILIRAQLLREVGLFDENIFIYVDDVDLNYRAQQKGWKLIYLPVASIIHKEKLQGYEMTSNAAFLLKRNIVYFFKKVGKSFDAYGYAFFTLGLMFLRMSIAIFRRERVGDYMKSYWRLLVAYWVIFTNRPYSKGFGPPYA
jgi:GT2 family glycosyltransferase